MNGIYFASLYFRVWHLTREIRENKNPAKISTYTVSGGKNKLKKLHHIPTFQVETLLLVILLKYLLFLKPIFHNVQHLVDGGISE